jgi:hypothetical protein
MVAVAPRRRNLDALSLPLGLEGESRAESGLGRLLGGLAAVGGGKQSKQDYKQAQQDRRNPRDPHHQEASRRRQLPIPQTGTRNRCAAATASSYRRAQ